MSQRQTGLIVNGTMRISPEDTDKFTALVQRNVQQTREAPGCIAYTFAVDVNDPNLFHNIEAWNSRDALEAHMKSEVMKAAFAEASRLRVVSRSVTAFDVTGSSSL